MDHSNSDEKECTGACKRHCPPRLQNKPNLLVCDASSSSIAMPIQMPANVVCMTANDTPAVTRNSTS